MTAILRRGRLAFLLLPALLSTGCSLSTLGYFLMPEAKTPPEMKQLAAEDKKEVRAVILTYSAELETRPEFIQADRQLSDLLARQLHELCKDNGENVTIVSPRKVEEFKSNHANWNQLADLSEVGRQFKADYVIYIEIGSLKLYEQGSANQLYRGQANLSVTLFGVNKPDDTTGPRQFSCLFPEAKGPIPADDMPPLQFREQFLGYVAKRLARFFVATPLQEQYTVE